MVPPVFKCTNFHYWEKQLCSKGNVHVWSVSGPEPHVVQLDWQSLKALKILLYILSSSSSSL